CIGDTHLSFVRTLAAYASPSSHSLSLFFFNDPAPTEIYTLSLHDALPISHRPESRGGRRRRDVGDALLHAAEPGDDGVEKSVSQDRKSTRLNSSHSQISYAVFCLKKKKKKKKKQKIKISTRATKNTYSQQP